MRRDVGSSLDTLVNIDVPSSIEIRSNKLLDSFKTVVKVQQDF